MKTRAPEAADCPTPTNTKLSPYLGLAPLWVATSYVHTQTALEHCSFFSMSTAQDPLPQRIANQRGPLRFIVLQASHSDEAAPSRAHKRAGRTTSTSLPTCLPDACAPAPKSGQSRVRQTVPSPRFVDRCCSRSLARLTDHILTRGPVCTVVVMREHSARRPSAPWPRIRYGCTSNNTATLSHMAIRAQARS